LPQALPGAHCSTKIQMCIKEFFVMKKKSRIEMAREIIANLRRGMNRPLDINGSSRNSSVAVTPYPAAPLNRSTRTRQFQTSHS
jgi:hypothetical protein